ncbi:MAG: sugar ABC transporter substrate-binding protein [Planctomycetota bacterium]|nr:sugar ABC transporter substrate-binding protein [Planctomycetota bacterium]
MMTHLLKTLLLAVVLVVVGGCGSGPAPDAGKNEGTPPLGDRALTIAWAEWVPSRVLKEMADEWGKNNNVEIRTAFYQWPKYQEKVYAAFASKSAAYDIIVGDSQWLGKGAVEGHYLELTDFLKKENLTADIEPAALRAFCEYPPYSEQYYAAPCEMDACGWAYRKDLFEDAKEKEAFKGKYNRELAVPKTWQELRDIAEFFTRPDQKLYGVAMFTDCGQYDAVTMGFEQVMWAWGAAYCDKDFKVEGVLNSKKGVEALEFYKELATKFMPPDSGNYYHRECLNAYMSGQVAMMTNFFALMPPLTDAKQCKYAAQTGYFAMPAGPGGEAFASLGGQGMSVSRYAQPRKQELAKKFIKWFLQTDNQKKWASHCGCFSASVSAYKDLSVRGAAPFNTAFTDSLPLLRDFYNTPEYAELLESCQKHWNAAIIGKETPKEAMDAIAKEHTEILKKAGALK